MIVLVIISVLAGLAIPAYTLVVEKSRKEEAFQALGTVRRAQQGYFTEHNDYASSFSSLTVDPTQVINGNIDHFTYALSGGGAGSSTYTCTATRNGVERPAGVAAYTVTIVQDGTTASEY